MKPLTTEESIAAYMSINDVHAASVRHRGNYGATNWDWLFYAYVQCVNDLDDDITETHQ